MDAKARAMIRKAAILGTSCSPRAKKEDSEFVKRAIDQLLEQYRSVLLVRDIFGNHHRVLGI